MTESEVNAMEYHERIKALRRQKGLTQQQLADEVGVSRQTVVRWENGWNVPALYYAQKLAQCLSVSVPQLMTGEEASGAGADGGGLLAPSVFAAFLSFVPVVVYFFLDAVGTVLWRAMLLQGSAESYAPVIAVYDGASSAAALFAALLLFAYWGCRLARAFGAERDGYARYTLYRHWKIGLAFCVTNGIVTAYNACVAMPHNIFNTLDWFVLCEYAAAAFFAVFIVLLFDIVFKRAAKGRMVTEKNRLLDKINLVYLAIGGACIAALAVCTVYAYVWGSAWDLAFTLIGFTAAAVAADVSYLVIRVAVCVKGRG